jgi:hypothetical protein
LKGKPPEYRHYSDGLYQAMREDVCLKTIVSMTIDEYDKSNFFYGENYLGSPATTISTSKSPVTTRAAPIKEGALRAHRRASPKTPASGRKTF